MAVRLPRPLRRRELFYGTDTPPETLSALADSYLSEGLVFDAADFFAQAHDREGLAHIRKVALEMGDAFLLRRVKEAMPDLIGESDWDDLARAATSMGKHEYAERAQTGGAHPPPPLQEELVQDEEALGEDSTGDDANLKPGQAKKINRKRAIQGG